ncbi:amylo-alpha-1,6-glucosidase [Deinococcus fonticola]|uniref:amylo-alpha-1,6-glucosidase n=1 Tax=Deinococcus fonticola TaxID=2528713 RepID=UPI00107509FB|nr:amylo-alpha-1,6-glucosidase [Deinococcus fonticola]
MTLRVPLSVSPGPASRHSFGPQAARDPALEVLLTDGLGGFALSSLAGVPTRCYSGLVVSQWPPVQRFTHLAAPLEELEVAGEQAALHALEIAPGVFEGCGLELLSGATLHSLLPQREQFWRGVRVQRRQVMPRESGALMFLYDVAARDSVTLTLGGFFTDRDMHTVHRQAPNLMFQASGKRVTVQGERETVVCLHLPEAEQGDPNKPTVSPLTPAPFVQRLYYRLDEARGEPSTEYARGCALWRVTFPPGGGRVALSVQGVTPQTPPVPDPWEALAAEMSRRDDLIERAWRATGVTDGVVATLALAADAYLVKRAQPDGTSVIAGYPWFSDWGRDTMIALTGLTLLTGRAEAAQGILRTYLHSVRRGLIPNHFHDDGGGAGYNTVDGALWLAVALERYVRRAGDATFARECLPALRELLGWHIEGTDHGIRVDAQDGLLRAGEGQVQLTWMDAKIHDWVVTPRHGKPVEIQALWLAALEAEKRLSEGVGEVPLFAEEYARAWQGFHALWPQSTLEPTELEQPAPHSQHAVLADGLGPGGQPDLSVRPNAVIALGLGVAPATDAQVDAVLAQAEAQLLTPLGLHTLSPLDSRYLGNYGGPQLIRDAAYHQGTVWPWPLGAYVELLLSRGEVRRARAALSGLLGHLWEAGLGHVSEVFSGNALHPGGCPFQAWSVAEVLRAHVLVSLAEKDQAQKG